MYGGLWPYQPVDMVPGYPWATADPLWPARFPGRGPLPADLAPPELYRSGKTARGFFRHAEVKNIFFFKPTPAIDREPGSLSKAGGLGSRGGDEHGGERENPPTQKSSEYS